MNTVYESKLGAVTTEFKDKWVMSEYYEKMIRTGIPQYPPNPFMFRIDMENNNILCFQKKPKRGSECIKMVARVLVRSHCGYCSCLDMDEDDPQFSEESKMVVLYFPIPRKYKNRRFHLRQRLYDANYKIIECKETEKMFLEWTHKSACLEPCQTGYCDYVDRYIPVELEYTFCPL